MTVNGNELDPAATELGEMDASDGAGATPLALSGTLIVTGGFPEVLTVIVPVRGPIVDGVTLKVAVHLPLGLKSNCDTQSSFSPKFAPLTNTVRVDSASKSNEMPTCCSTVCPTGTFPKSTALVDKVTVSFVVVVSARRPKQLARIRRLAMTNARLARFCAFNLRRMLVRFLTFDSRIAVEMIFTAASCDSSGYWWQLSLGFR